MLTPSISSRIDCPESESSVITISGRPFRLPISTSTPASTPSSTTSDVHNTLLATEISRNIAEDCCSDSFSYTFDCPSSLKAILIKEQGRSYLQDLEDSFNAHITFTHTHMTVTSSSRDNVLLCSSTISEKLNLLRRTAPPTHFLALPLLYSKTTASELLNICSQIKSVLEPQPKFKPSHIVDPKEFHITLLMINAYYSDDIDKIKQILHEHSLEIQNMLNDLSVTLGPLAVMKGSQQSCKVLHFDIINDSHSQRIHRFREVLSYHS
ncbi:hypothetical protein GEMRC1_001864 [Eukaryota sp. GEM-RC1]